jgi:hypothetical protein
MSEVIVFPGCAFRTTPVWSRGHEEGDLGEIESTTKIRSAFNATSCERLAA